MDGWMDGERMNREMSERVVTASDKKKGRRRKDESFWWHYQRTKSGWAPHVEEMRARWERERNKRDERWREGRKGLLWVKCILSNSALMWERGHFTYSARRGEGGGGGRELSNFNFRTYCMRCSANCPNLCRISPNASILHSRQAGL